MRLHTRTDRTLHLEPVGDLHWDRGSVNAGADIALGPSGLLLVADEQRGRVVMVDPESGAVRGVRLEGIRVDTDVAQYAGIAWDGYNDRTAMFDRSTGQLIVDSRADNSIVAFDLRSAGVDDAEAALQKSSKTSELRCVTVKSASVPPRSLSRHV